jgi:hypothetical protein
VLVAHATVRHRTQEQNLKDALEKLQDIASEASVVPKERIETERPEWAERKRLDEKKLQKKARSTRKMVYGRDY